MGCQLWAGLRDSPNEHLPSTLLETEHWAGWTTGLTQQQVSYLPISLTANAFRLTPGNSPLKERKY